MHTNYVNCKPPSAVDMKNIHRCIGKGLWVQLICSSHSVQIIVYGQCKIRIFYAILSSGIFWEKIFRQGFLQVEIFHKRNKLLQMAASKKLCVFSLCYRTEAMFRWRNKLTSIPRVCAIHLHACNMKLRCNTCQVFESLRLKNNSLVYIWAVLAKRFFLKENHLQTFLFSKAFFRWVRGRQSPKNASQSHSWP